MRSTEAAEPFGAGFKIVAVLAVLGVCAAIGFYFRVPGRIIGGPVDASGPTPLSDAATGWKTSYEAFAANVRPRKLGDRGTYEYAVGFGHLTLGEPFTWELTLKEVHPETGPVFDVPPLPEPCGLNWRFAYRDVPRFRKLRAGQKVRITGRLTGAVQVADDPHTPETTLVGQTLPLSPEWNKANDPNNWELSELPKRTSVVPTNIRFSLDVSNIKLADPASVTIPADEAALYAALDAAATREAGIHTTKPVSIPREFDVQSLDVAALARIAAGDEEVRKIVGHGKDLSNDAILLLEELGPKARPAAPAIIAKIKSGSGLGVERYLKVLDSIGAAEDEVPLGEIWPAIERELMVSGDEQRMASLREWAGKRIGQSPAAAQVVFHDETLSPTLYDLAAQIAGVRPGLTLSAPLSPEVRTIVLLKLLRGDNDTSNFSERESECAQFAIKELEADLQNNRLTVTPATVPDLLKVAEHGARYAGNSPSSQPLGAQILSAISTKPDLAEPVEPRLAAMFEIVAPADRGVQEFHRPYADALARLLGTLPSKHEEHVALLVRLWGHPAGVEGLVAIAKQKPELTETILTKAWDAKAAALAEDPSLGDVPSPTIEDLRKTLDADGKHLRPLLLKRMQAQMSAISKEEFGERIYARQGKPLLATLVQLGLDKPGAEDAAKQLLAAVGDGKSYTLAARAYFVFSLRSLGPAAKETALPQLESLMTSIKLDGPDSGLRPEIQKMIDFYVASN